MEGRKIQTIAKDLLNSTELKSVSKPYEMEEFEVITNKDFNESYEKDIRSSGEFTNVQFKFDNAKRPRRRLGMS